MPSEKRDKDFFREELPRGVVLYRGDCLDVMRGLPDGSVDMVLCDLPYGVSRCGWDCEVDTAELWGHYRRLLRSGGLAVLFGQGMFTARMMCASTVRWRYNLIWEKTHPSGFLNARRMPLRSHEDIMVFYDRLPVYNPQMVHGMPRKVSTAAHKRGCRTGDVYGAYGHTDYDSTDRFPKSVLRFPQDFQRGRWHPTQKPVALLEWLVRTYTDGGFTVMDNCMGSGSTGVACALSGRRFVGIEKDPSYYLSASARIRASLS